MTKTITRIYSTFAKAEEIVRSLEAADISHSDITLVSGDKSGHSNVRAYPSATGEGKAEGEVLYETTVSGGVIGGVGGLLAGLGLLAIPGFGPIAAAGWLVATLAGVGIGTAAASGAELIANALSGAGVNQKDAYQYAERVRNGGSLVAVKTEDSKTGMVESIMGLNDTGFDLGDTVDPETGRKIA